MPCNKSKYAIRSRRGLTLVEASSGFIVIIPIALGVIDLVALISLAEINEQWAEMACRAAATRQSANTAQKAAQNCLDDFEPQSVAKQINLVQVQFDPAKGQVSVVTEMVTKMPVPIPFVGDINLKTASTQPIVGIPAPE